jgi:C4-dicarboxylate transporter DctM subunit
MTPIGESKSDYEVVLEVARKLNLEEEVSEGKTINEWIEYLFNDHFGFKDFISNSGPILILFIVVIGGIYAGVFSAMEGGGIGAFMTFIIALLMRRITWKTFWAALMEAGEVVGLLIFMIVCALVYGHVLAASNLTTMLAHFVGGLHVSQLAIVAAMAVLYLFFGFIMDSGVALILTLPILAPIAAAVGIDLIWLGVVVILVCNLGMITPPYAIIVFMLRGLAPDIPLSTMYRGVMPFVLSSVVVAILILFFPVLSTWLPSILQ